MPFSLRDLPVTLVRNTVIAIGPMTLSIPGQDDAATSQMPHQMQASPK